MITTNTGAKKLESSDNWREIFPNSTLGTAGAHNASVDAADRIQPEIAPIINGKQCALGAAKDDYVLLRNSTITGKSDGAYIAAKAIPANTDIDSTYLGNAITGGISNSLNGNLTTKNITSKFTSLINNAELEIYQSGNIIYVVANSRAYSVGANSSAKLCAYPTGYTPKGLSVTENAGTANVARTNGVRLLSDGIYFVNTASTSADFVQGTVMYMI